MAKKQQKGPDQTQPGQTQPQAQEPEEQEEVKKPNTSDTAYALLATYMGALTTGTKTMNEVNREVGSWWRGLSEEDKKSLAKNVNEKAQQIKMIAEGLSSEIYVLTSPYI